MFFGGGAGGGKSWWLCETRLVKCYLIPGYKSFLGREELKRLMGSTYITWSKVCSFHNIPSSDWKLNGQYNYIEFKNGSRIDLLDLKFQPSDPMYERFGSLEYTDGAIEEAGEVHPLAKDVLGSRIGRHLNKERKVRPTMAITGNPKKNWTYKDYYKPWREKTLPDNIAFIQSLYSDNPHTASEYKKQLAQIKDKATKERLMFGNWEYDDDPATMIEYDAILDLFSNPTCEGKRFLSVDVARYGRDRSVIMLWNDMTVEKIWTFRKLGIDQLAEQVRNKSLEFHVPYSQIIADDDGVGGGLVDTMRGIKGFVNNSKPIKQENYQNLKTQCYYKLAKLVNEHVISVKEISESDKKELIEELEQLKTKDSDKDGKLKIVPKEDLKELLGRSPDLMDGMMMRMWYELRQEGGSVKRVQKSVYTY